MSILLPLTKQPFDLPLLIGGVAILGAFAVLRGLTTLTDVAPYAINVVTMLGLGVTIDYALFTITRFREELNSNGQDVCAALERTVIFSALTVSTSLLSLLLFPVPYLRSLGLGAISTILVVMLISLTLLPVLLALLGRRVDALALSRIFKSRRASGKEPRARTGVQQGMWYRLAETVMRWPVPVTLVVLIILLVLGIPFLHIKFATVGINILPANQEVRVVNERLSQDFVHQGNAQISIIVQTPGSALEPDSLASLDCYVGLALAVVMDATLIRTLLLPATMRLLGTFNWWAPAPLRWLWQYIGLKETASIPALSGFEGGGLDAIGANVRNDELIQRRKGTPKGLESRNKEIGMQFLRWNQKDLFRTGEIHAEVIPSYPRELGRASAG